MSTSTPDFPTHTNPDDRTTEMIEQDIEATRQRVDALATELQSRITPMNLIREATDEVRVQTRQMAASQQLRLANAIEDVASGLGDAAAREKNGSVESGALAIGAKASEAAAELVRNVDLANSLDDLRRAVERQPIAFALGAASVGFLAARFLKSSNRY